MLVSVLQHRPVNDSAGIFGGSAMQEMIVLVFVVEAQCSAVNDCVGVCGGSLVQ